MVSNRLVLAAAVIAALVIGFGAGVFAAPQLFPAMHRGQSPMEESPGRSGSANMTGTPFSSFQYASSAYLISGNATMSASGKVATEDFNLTTTPLENGSIEYSIKFDGRGGRYNITISHDDKLYYIDTNLADDMPGADASIGDEGYAVVNSTGYVIVYKYPLPNT